MALAQLRAVVGHQRSPFIWWDVWQRQVRAFGRRGAGVARRPLQRPARSGPGLAAGLRGCLVASQERQKAPVKLSHTRREQQVTRGFIHFTSYKTGFILQSFYIHFNSWAGPEKKMDVIIFCIRN